MKNIDKTPVTYFDSQAPSVPISFKRLVLSSLELEQARRVLIVNIYIYNLSNVEFNFYK